MTLVTEALDRIARQCSVSAPSSWVTATADEHKELRDDFLLETVDDILCRIDLPAPIGAQTAVVGTGVETYSLPADFKRLMRDNLAVYDTFHDRPVLPISTDGEWAALADLGASLTAQYYRITGYEDNWSISFFGYPSASISITVSYISTAWITNASTEKASFTDPADALLLPRRIVESGTVWRWRERRGLPYRDKYMEYEALIARLSNDSRTRRTVNFGPRNTVRWQDNIPSVIPTS